MKDAGRNHIQAQDYATGQFGKNHLGDPNEQLPTVHRFDGFFGLASSRFPAAERPVRRAPEAGPSAPGKTGPRRAAGFSSMLSFLLIARMVGGYSAQIQRLIVGDVVGVAALAGACLVHAFWLGATGA